MAEVTTEILEKATTFVSEMLTKAGFTITVDAKDEDGVVAISILGEDAESLVLRDNGAATPDTLEAISRLVKQVLGHQGGYNVSVDAASYRGKRIAEFEELSEDVADMVLDGIDVTIFGMNSIDRRAMHRQLGEAEGLDTQSKGYGVFRRLVVRTAKDAKNDAASAEA